MKKVMAIWMVIALLCLPVLALAEQGEAVVTVDWTALVVAVIGTAAAVLGACLRQVWVKHVRPWLEQRDLSDAHSPGVMERIEASAGALTGSLDTSSIASRAPFNEDESSASSSFIVLPLFNRQRISRMVCGGAFNAIDFNRSK